MTRLSTTPVLFIVLVCSGVACAKQEARANSPAQVLTDFKTRIDQYVDMRKKADDGVPKQKETSDPGQIRERQAELAESIRLARAGAKHGDIFTPEITTHFRRLLRPEMKERGTKAVIADDNPGKFWFNINGPYPEDEPLSTVPANVLATLPQLPEELEYRFVSKHLILRDARANIIIDYIPNAIA